MNGVEYAGGLICDKISRKIPNSETYYTIKTDSDEMLFKTLIRIGDEKHCYGILIPILHAVIGHNSVADEIVSNILTEYPNLL